MLASLNHPNIGSIYGLEESNNLRVFVLELVEGPTLADRIAGGQSPWKRRWRLPGRSQMQWRTLTKRESRIVT